MASAPFTLSTSTPEDNMIVSQFPANERTFRDNVKSFLETDHDAATGGHKYVTLKDQETDPTFGTGLVGVWQRDGALLYRLASGTISSIDHLPEGTKMIFAQASAPTGWVLDTDVNDRVLRMSSTAGAGTGGSWTISGLAVDAHTHSISIEWGTEGNNQSRDVAGGSGERVAEHTHDHDFNYTGNTGSATATITHTPGWRPSYIDVIKATKDGVPA